MVVDRHQRYHICPNRKPFAQHWWETRAQSAHQWYICDFGEDRSHFMPKLFGKLGNCKQCNQFFCHCIKQIQFAHKVYFTVFVLLSHEHQLCVLSFLWWCVSHGSLLGLRISVGCSSPSWVTEISLFQVRFRCHYRWLLKLPLVNIFNSHSSSCSLPVIPFHLLFCIKLYLFPWETCVIVIDFPYNFLPIFFLLFLKAARKS